MASPSLLSRAQAPATVADLRAMPTVGYRSSEVRIATWPYLVGGDVRTVEVAPVCWASDGNALLDLVLRGVGVGYLSRFAAAEHVRRGDLVVLFPEVALPAFDPVYVVHAPEAQPSPKVAAFRRALVDVARELEVG